ncbi:MAG: sodium-translocating pyrophosphatase [Phycisphaerales bacterium]
MTPVSLTLAADMHPAYFLAPVAAIVALAMAFVFSSSVMKRSEGDAEMIRIAQAVRDGAMAYLVRQYKVVAGVFVILVIVLAVMAFVLKLQPTLSLIGVPVAGFFSGLCGWFGMKMATNASARTTFAAKDSLNDALTVAFRSGAVMGLIVVGFALLDASAWYFILNTFTDFGPVELTTILLSFGMGASTQALFARVGGGIYTKAADVGADLVGKVEAGIPEDDPRNPATIADNVGDNVGDVAGMGADLYESYYGSMFATMALGAAAAFTLGLADGEATKLAVALTTAPLALAGMGIFCSILGIFTVKAKEGANFAQLLKGLHKGVYIASFLIAVLAFGLFWFIFGQNEGPQLPIEWWRLPLAILVGLVAGNVIAVATEYYTSYEHAPTKRIAAQAITGPATVIIAGIAEGMKSTWASLLTVVVAILAAFILAGGNDSFLMGLYGVGIAAVGMLSTLGITLATDAYGPIADNAGGNAEMTGQPPHVRERTDMLDSLGNTTAATGKGFAIGSAALTALALFAAFIQIVQVQITTQSKNYLVANPQTVSAPSAVYEGYGKFAIEMNMVDDEGKAVTDGAMLLELTGGHDPNPKATNVFTVGEAYPITTGTFGDHYYAVSATVAHDGHDDIYTARLASSSNGSIKDVLAFYDVTLTNPRLLGGLFLGVLLTFLFCALTMNAVGRAAYDMMNEARRQFGKMRDALRAKGMSEEDVNNSDNWPMEGIDHEGTHYPDYATCVSISTAGAQREMVVPALLAIVIPIVVGLFLSVPGVMGMLAGGLTSGFAVAIFMANAGGAWDNAKKLLESYGKIKASEAVADPNKIPAEVREPILAKAQEMVQAGQGDAIVYGKGSDDHKATVVGDTVGDPFKDTSGPSLNILIKLISIVSVVFAGLTVAYGPMIGSLLGLN